MSARILLVTARVAWSTAVAAALTSEGFSVEHRAEGASITTDEHVTVADLAVIDLDLADMSGASVCAALRSRSAVPIMVIGQRGDEPGIVGALAAGADAFVAEDATPREVVARVRALQRRVPKPERALDAGALAHGGITLDLRTRVVRLRGKDVEVGAPESEILEALLRRPGLVVPRGELLALLGLGRGRDHLLDLHVRRLRDRLEAVEEQRRIRTVRGVGFVLDDARSGDDDIDLSGPPALAGTP